MLQRGDPMPMFSATNHLSQTRLAYEDIWQRSNLLLVRVPSTDLEAAYVDLLTARSGELQQEDVRLVITENEIPGVPSPGVVIADRWGEIIYIAGADHPSALPDVDELSDWLQYVRNRCPECEGETR